ncbi:lipopolysaccharide biosynthesis protein [Deinococcus radiopugnans]|uniref:Lipopolysaccharide biosynthesis protein n=1 Tax=Deinococcus radiopugnans ATCC 19172 TaxID=585398 RepID=A0A5C4Y9C3_9DEIO|nr:lipopolysaccharide biosynthesis protein [Deinococcus radiopugnans]MBB6014912.1 O-antigen/teichoic acid export membrane protein [Deinococcus radiopugnans ATCC 19172]TNM71672.1 lipopolysaccharide biosynthesis protein [Deinococcus radiopugnans ATCC 19172]
MSSLKEKTVNAMKWSYLSMFVGLALQLFFAAILSRLLTKQEFGVWAIAAVLQRFGQFITDLGIGRAIVQKAKLTEQDIRAGFTAAMLLGLLTTVLAWLVAPAASRFYPDLPNLTTVFRGYALVYMLSSGIIISSSLLRRALNFKPLVRAELTSYAIGHGVIGLGAAYLGYGTLSLVVSAIAQAVIQLALLYSATRHSVKPVFNWSAYQGLLSFGVKATAVSLLEYLSSILDTLIIGKLYSPVALGAYSRTFSTLAMPATNFASSLSRVMAPSFSAVQNEPERLRRAYLSGLRAVAIVISSATGCILIDAPEIVKVMLGPNYLDSITLMQIFALYIPFAVLTNLSAVLAEATARLNVKIGIQAAYLVTLGLAFWLTYSLGGRVEEIAMVLVGTSALRSAAFAVVARSIIGGGGRQIALTYGMGALYFAGSALFTAAVVFSLRSLNLPLPVLFIAEMALGLLVVASVVLLGPPSELQTMARAAVQQLRGRLINSTG